MEGKQKQKQAIPKRGEGMGLTKHNGSGIATDGQNTGVWTPQN